MKILIGILFLNSLLFAYETYPYKARERESLGTILYSIGAKRLWGDVGSVKKHTEINQINANHEFKDSEVIRLAKEDIRFKCNVILKGDILVIKRALITKKDRQKLLEDHPNCLQDEIVQLAKKRVKVYASTRAYVKQKAKRYKKKLILKEKASVTAPEPKINITQSSVVRAPLKLAAEHRVSYISTRNAFNYKAENQDQINTVANATMGMMYEHLQKENGNGIMANFSLAIMAPDAQPNYSFSPTGSLSYELGYNFNDQFMLATAVRFSNAQFQKVEGELSDINFSEFLIRSIYRTRFFKKENHISLTAGGIQSSEALQGYSVGMRSEILAQNFSFSVFYDYKNLYEESSELSQNLFGLSIGKLF